MHPNRTTNVLTNEQVSILSSFDVQQIQKEKDLLYITLKEGSSSVVIYKYFEEVAILWANDSAYKVLGIKIGN